MSAVFIVVTILLAVAFGVYCIFGSVFFDED